MTSPTLLDTGPLVAYIDRREKNHEWVKSQFGRVRAPMETCEAVITEACFLLQRVHQGTDSVMQMVSRGVIALPFRLGTEIDSVSALMHKYANVPMSLADACLVRMAEQHDQSAVFTLDSDFRIYRKSNRQVIPVIMPK